MLLRRRLVAPVLAVAVGAGVIGACGGSPERSATAFCTELDRELPGLEGPTQTQADLDALVARYDGLNEIAPLAIEDDWQELTDLVVTAATVVPTDPTSVQIVADAAYRTERAARRLEAWVSATCGLTMPAVVGLEAPATVPVESTPAP